ncbi:MAG: COP23 domain-containing protein [Xenococcaceae cyanobacterium]
MKPQLLTSVLTFSALTLATTFTASSPARAQTTNFVCGVSQGVPATIAKTLQGDVPVIRWVSNYFKGSGYDPQTRCEMVSDRFQNYYNTGTLKFLTTGRMNRQNVVCVAEYNGGPCAGLLFTLKPGSSPGQTLQRLMAVRTRALGPLNETNARIYIDINQYLTEATGSGTDSGSPTVPPNPTPSREGQSDSPVW